MLQLHYRFSFSLQATHYCWNPTSKRNLISYANYSLSQRLNSSHGTEWKKKTSKSGQELNALKDRSVVYKSFRWYQIALWAKGMTKANTQLQGFPSVHSIHYANHMQMLEVKVPALSKKVRGLSRITICTLSLSFPPSLLPPERAAGTMPFPAAPASELGSPTPLHHPASMVWTDPHFNNGWHRACCHPFPATLRGSD